jgi:hypothetical protein
MSNKTYQFETMKRGLCINDLFIEGENRNAYHDMFQGFLEDFKPVNTIELALVQEMAECYWLRERALRYQVDAFWHMHHKGEHRAAPRELLVLIRYQSSNERSFHRALETLQKMQKQRLKQRQSPASGNAPGEGLAQAKPQKQTNSPKPEFVSQIAPEPIAGEVATPQAPENPEPTNT